MRKISSFLTAVISVVILCVLQVSASAKAIEIHMAGRTYEFDEESRYEYAEAETYQEITSGILSISGNIAADSQNNETPSYRVSANNVSLTYTLSEYFPVTDSDGWNLAQDNGKTVADVKLKKPISKGALIVQTSKDGLEWINDATISNAFIESNLRDFYTTNDIQVSNGCYYRIIAAYKVERKTGESRILIFNREQFEYKKFVEVYEFYLHGNEGIGHAESSQSMALGDLTKANKDSGYSGDNKIGINDPHFGWELGQFFVSGYTRAMENQDGTPVFLKNVGDQITLQFLLKQDIDALNGKDILSIADDKDGYDQSFQISKMDMKRGALLIRYTDEKNVKHRPEIYTNYLEANASTGANTLVKLFEEGDYEVALDYKVKKTPRKIRGLAVLPEYSDYRIFLKFSVRNGNCMIYPFDAVTGVELSDKAITSNGFRLDMAKSRYLNIDVKKSVLVRDKRGYVEDVRFNRPAKDGDEYTDEGIYAFSVKNLYTGESTVKTIYVGSSNEMKALAKNGGSVEALNVQIQIEEGTETVPSENYEGSKSTSQEIDPSQELAVVSAVPVEETAPAQDANFSPVEETGNAETFPVSESETEGQSAKETPSEEDVSEQEQAPGAIKTLWSKFLRVFHR